MSALLLLGVCVALGMVLTHIRPAIVGYAQPLNWWVLNIALPALVLEAIPKLALDRHFWYLPVSLWMVFGVAWLLFAMLGRLCRWAPQRVGALILSAGLGNTLFIGYPLIEALRGREALRLAVLADQTGCFIALLLGGTAVIGVYARGDTQRERLARRVLRAMVTTPALYALLLGFAAGSLGGWPNAVDDTLQRLGSTLTPIALFAAGLQLSLKLGRGRTAPLVAGLGYKLLGAPLLVWGAAVLFGVTGLTQIVSVLQAAMGPMVTASVMARQHDLEPELAVTLLGFGIVMSAATVPAIDALL